LCLPYHACTWKCCLAVLWLHLSSGAALFCMCWVCSCSGFGWTALGALAHATVFVPALAHA
jgi:hypothetical protein